MESEHDISFALIQAQLLKTVAIPVIILRPKENKYRPEAVELLMNEEDHEKNRWINHQVDRHFITVFYKSVLKSPSPEEWERRNGIFAHITKTLHDMSLNAI